MREPAAPPQRVPQLTGPGGALAMRTPETSIVSLPGVAIIHGRCTAPIVAPPCAKQRSGTAIWRQSPIFLSAPVIGTPATVLPMTFSVTSAVGACTTR